MSKAKKEPDRCKWMVPNTKKGAKPGAQIRCSNKAGPDGACDRCRPFHRPGSKTSAGRAKQAAGMRKHGIYARGNTKEENEQLPALIANIQNLEPDIVQKRITIRRIWHLILDITEGIIESDNPWHEGNQEVEVSTRETEGKRDKDGKPVKPTKNTYTKKKSSKNMPSLESLYLLLDRHTRTLVNMERELFIMRQSRPPDDEEDFARKVLKLIQMGNERTGGDADEAVEK